MWCRVPAGPQGPTVTGKEGAVREWNGEDQVAGEDQMFVCGCCGKMSKTRYGLGDTSCVMHALLCPTAGIIVGDDGRAEQATICEGW